MIFVDGHVHIYDCFDLDLLFDSAWNNFESAASLQAQPTQHSRYVLFLTEGKTESWYRKQVEKQRESGSREIQVSTRWSGVFSESAGLLKLHRRDGRHEELYLLPGVQVVTAEKIEVLALFCAARIRGGALLTETVNSIQQSGGISILPWGAGKWLGKRGRLVHALLTDSTRNGVFSGDNGGRPALWPAPTVCTSAQSGGYPVLSGTDPLPFPDEARRVGSFGFWIEDNGSAGDDLASCIKRALLIQHSIIHPFGNVLKNWKFVHNQLRLRLAD